MSLSENKMLIEEGRRRRKKSGCEGEATLDLFFFLLLLHSVPINCHKFSFALLVCGYL
jgi:hypothetical protein